MTPREEFIRITYILSRSSPMAWADFIAAFDRYTTSELEKATSTTTADMAISLGMSRRMNELRNDFRDIEILARKLKVAA